MQVGFEIRNASESGNHHLRIQYCSGSGQTMKEPSEVSELTCSIWGRQLFLSPNHKFFYGQSIGFHQCNADSTEFLWYWKILTINKREVTYTMLEFGESAISRRTRSFWLLFRRIVTWSINRSLFVPIGSIVTVSAFINCEFLTNLERRRVQYCSPYKVKENCFISEN